jgi:hypothetical protein
MPPDADWNETPAADAPAADPAATPKDNGPTVAEWVNAGYLAANYPPSGYASKSTPEEIAAAVAAQAAAPEKPAAPAPAAMPSEFDAPVKVRCIVHTRPHTDLKALAHEEIAEVSAWLAKAMLKLKQVELV